LLLLNKGRFLFGITAHIFENPYIAAKAIEGSARVGVSRDSFGELLQKLSTEIEVARDSVRTEKEKQVIRLYDEVMETYRDSMKVWQMKNRLASIRSRVSSVSNDMYYKVYTTDLVDKDLATFKKGREYVRVLERWREALDAGLLPAYPAEQDTVAMPDGRDLGEVMEFKSIADRHHSDLLISTIEGYAFLPPDATQALWKKAITKTAEARRLTGSW